MGRKAYFSVVSNAWIMYAPVLFLAYILHELYCANVRFGHLCFVTWYSPRAPSFTSLVVGIHALARSAAVAVVTIPSAANSGVKRLLKIFLLLVTGVFGVVVNTLSLALVMRRAAVQFPAHCHTLKLFLQYWCIFGGKRLLGREESQVR